MSSLGDIIESFVQDGESLVLDAPEEWAQGRTLFGGMTASLCYSALARLHGDLGPLRSALFSFVGPAAGRLTFRPTLLRRGRSATIANVDCLNEDGLAARALFTFGQPRDSAVAHDHTPRRPVPPPDACEPFHKTSRLPGFLNRFEMRLADGARLMERDKHPAFAVWSRLRDGDAPDPVATLLTMGDALPSAAWVSFPKAGPVSTMTWSVDFFQPLAFTGGWHLVTSESERAADGYSLQPMRIYNEAGEPLVSARQTVALFV